MKKSIIRDLTLYGLCIAGILMLVKFMDYGLFVRRIPFEIYVGVIALLFTSFGIWMGLKLTSPKVRLVEGATSFPQNPEDLNHLLQSAGISSREYEVLQLIADGHSNKEIADRLFISISTVKSHTSHLFDKLDVRRRTQVIQKGKELGLLP